MDVQENLTLKIWCKSGSSTITQHIPGHWKYPLANFGRSDNETEIHISRLGTSLIRMSPHQSSLSQWEQMICRWFSCTYKFHHPDVENRTILHWGQIILLPHLQHLDRRLKCGVLDNFGVTWKADSWRLIFIDHSIKKDTGIHNSHIFIL